jgi:hypothetical protein
VRASSEIINGETWKIEITINNNEDVNQDKIYKFKHMFIAHYVLHTQNTNYLIWRQNKNKKCNDG